VVTELEAFLRARLDEDYASALTAREAALGIGQWEPDPWHPETIVVEDDAHEVLYIVPTWDMCPELQRRETAIHITRWDPAHVLADIASKRRIIAEHEESAEFMNRPENRHVPAGETHGLYTALKMLALPYDQHPDFRQEWRP
jgi:hypothetical protein